MIMNAVTFDSRDGSELINIVSKTKDSLLTKQFERKCGMLFMRIKKRALN